MGNSNKGVPESVWIQPLPRRKAPFLKVGFLPLKPGWTLFKLPRHMCFILYFRKPSVAHVSLQNLLSGVLAQKAKSPEVRRESQVSPVLAQSV